MSSKVILELVLGIALALSLLVPASGASAESVPLPHEGPWPIHNGHNYQPTERDLQSLHLEDVTPDQVRTIDRLYDELLANSEGGRKRQPAP
jgi:hypothetical protein